MKKQIQIPFSKMSGTGNDFVVIDNRPRLLTGRETRLFSEWCQRRFSIGADGVILMGKGENAPVHMRYFNSDGQEAAMCGNGARCAGYFVFEKKLVSKRQFSMETETGLHRLSVSQENVRVSMPHPTEWCSDFNILKETGWIEGGFINIGVPHYIIFVDDIESISVEKTAPYYRFNAKFKEGANIDFVQRMSDNSLRVRTFERGIEGETLSCGTGSVASALTASKRFNLSSPIAIATRGGKLSVGFNHDWSDIWLSGRVALIYEGLIV